MLNYDFDAVNVIYWHSFASVVVSQIVAGVRQQIKVCDYCFFESKASIFFFSSSAFGGEKARANNVLSRVLNAVGEKCATFPDRTVRNITTDSLQIDEF